MALADIIAARKAEAAKKAEMQAQATTNPPVSFQNVTKDIPEEKVEEKIPEKEKKEEKKEIVLSFAEKMRLKREQEAAQKTLSIVKQEISEEKATSENVAEEKKNFPEEKKESKEEENNEDKIAYINIKEKIDALDSFMDDELPEPMGELKRALLANPNACLLMLDEDIGKMTIALRRLVQESLVEKAEKKPKGRKTKNTGQLNLSAEDIDKVFAELDDF